MAGLDRILADLGHEHREATADRIRKLARTDLRLHDLIRLEGAFPPASLADYRDMLHLTIGQRQLFDRLQLGSWRWPRNEQRLAKLSAHERLVVADIESKWPPLTPDRLRITLAS